LHGRRGYPQQLTTITEEPEPKSVVFRRPLKLIFFRGAKGSIPCKGVPSGRGVNEIRKIMLAPIVICLLFLTIGTVHASVGNHRDSGTEQVQQPTGVRLSMYRGFRLGSCSVTNPNIAPGDTSFPASSAFFVSHGWISDFFTDLNATEKRAFSGPNTTFELYVDGVETSPQHDFSLENSTYLKLFVSNFAGGLTGTHVLVGWWFIDAGLNGDGAFGTRDFALACNLRVHFT
jgi:hypothetical protein